MEVRARSEKSVKRLHFRSSEIFGEANGANTTLKKLSRFFYARSLNSFSSVVNARILNSNSLPSVVNARNMHLIL